MDMQVVVQPDDAFKDELMKTLTLEVRNLLEPKKPYTPFLKGITELQHYVAGISYYTARELIIRGLPYTKVGNMTYFDKDKVREFINNYHE